MPSFDFYIHNDNLGLPINRTKNCISDLHITQILYMYVESMFQYAHKK